MAKPKVLLLHPGHSFSTSDVFDGLAWGLAWSGADVVAYRWDQQLQVLGRIATLGVSTGVVSPEQGEQFQAFCGYLASADALAVALVEEVDAVLVVNGLLFPPERAALLRRLNIPVACYGTEAPYVEAMERQIAPFYSHWFTQERRSVARMQDLVPTTYLPLAYHPERHALAAPDPDKRVDAVFVGGGYPERRALLDGVDWATGGPDGRRITHARVGTLWTLDLDAEAARGGPGRNRAYSAGAVPNAVTAAWHRSARISLNLHRRMTTVETRGRIADGVAESCNPRVYEVPAVGGFLLCDDARPELADILGDAAATYRADDAADLTYQLRSWLSRPGSREAAARAQYEAIQPHHYGARAATVLETLIP